jgi:L-asparagine oxygenase
VSILYGSHEDPNVKFNPLMIGIDAAAENALLGMVNVAERLKKPIHLEPSDLLIVSNKTVLHDRSVFQPKYNGKDSIYCAAT